MGIESINRMSTPDIRMASVMIGIVTNNKDPEKQARVKLKLPILGLDKETDWVRIATLMGGKEMGSLFIPEVNDEVLVAFHLGDLSQPIVIGTLWNGKQAPPKGEDNNTVRKIVSKKGHEITFNDDDSKAAVTVKTKKGHTLELSDKDDKLTVKDKSGNNSIVMDGSGNKVTIKSSTSEITMSASGDISIKSNKAIELSSTQIKLEAKAQLSLKAGMVDINADGILNIKGSMVKIN
ncbi:phage baseplate assembly protein V [Paenibacillus koleovorans]|uniref:phage baseplate assembly protein V n=1 Tax=Paenibacillus koleovorans TaxID=121608 RepID=UPI000FDB835D|nr:phage baseplate assembly protein V [Paenibacillus koleovorans]